MNNKREKILEEIELIEKGLEKKLSIQSVDEIRKKFGFSYTIPIKALEYKNFLLKYDYEK